MKPWRGGVVDDLVDDLEFAKSEVIESYHDKIESLALIELLFI